MSVIVWSRIKLYIFKYLNIIVTYYKKFYIMHVHLLMNSWKLISCDWLTATTTTCIMRIYAIYLKFIKIRENRRIFNIKHEKFIIIYKLVFIRNSGTVSNIFIHHIWLYEYSIYIYRNMIIIFNDSNYNQLVYSTIARLIDRYILCICIHSKLIAF